MTLPLIDDRAAAELRHIEAEAAKLLPQASALLDGPAKPGPAPKSEKSRVRPSQANRSKIVRSAAALLEACERSALPPPPSLAAVLATLLNPRPPRRTVAPEKMAAAIAYVAQAEDEGRTVSALELHRETGISEAKCGDLLRGEDLWEGAAELRMRQDQDREASHDRPTFDMCGIVEGWRWARRRRAALADALAPSASGAAIGASGKTAAE